MGLRAKIVLPTPDAVWVRELELPFPPFPGLGIRLHVEDLLIVRSVVVGDFGFEATCVVALSGVEPRQIADAKLTALCFEAGSYP